MVNGPLASALASLTVASAVTVLAQAPTPVVIPPANHAVRLDKSVLVPMRDGVLLATDLYFPERAGGKLPVILIRTPYNKNSFRAENSRARQFAGHGYIVAVQDVRGKFESQGDYVVSAADTLDGYDTVEWLAEQSWATGKVGTYGCSYLGENQLEMAKLRHPAHAAMIPQASGGSRRYFAAIQGGAFELLAGFNWFRTYGAKIRPQLSPARPGAAYGEAAEFFNLGPVLPDIDLKSAIRALPVVDLLKTAGAPPSDFEGFVSHEPDDPWWEQFGYVRANDRFNTPALFLDSWYDYGVADTFALFEQHRQRGQSARARENQYVVIAPTVHCQYELAGLQTVVGQRELGDAQFDYFRMYLRWFDYWLKNIDNGVTTMPRVQIYVMGRNAWRGEDDWPLARAKLTKYYLHSDGDANSRFGNGTLSTVAPDQEPPDDFTYDPANPVPSVGGPDWGASLPGFLPGGMDQSEVEMRHDVLVYTSASLDRGLEVTGPLRAVLYVSSSARDTDFTAKLVDVYPDGRAFNVQEGIIRARYREGYGKKLLMQSGAVYEVSIDLQVTSNYFAPGHRVRLEVSSSNFPRFDRNLNTGGNNFDESRWLVATNTIHHSARHASHVLLPVIP